MEFIPPAEDFFALCLVDYPCILYSTVHIEWAQRQLQVASIPLTCPLVSVMLFALFGRRKRPVVPIACEMVLRVPIWTRGGIMVLVPGLCSVSGTGEGGLLAGTV